MNPNTKYEAFQIAGDKPARTSFAGPNFVDSALCNPVILWRDRLLTVDVYAFPGQPRKIMLFCPLCRDRHPDSDHSLTISEGNKAFDVDPVALPKIPGFTTEELVRYLGLPDVNSLRGRISIEPFKCTWEEQPDLKRGFGFSVCPWSVKVDNNIAKDV